MWSGAEPLDQVFESHHGAKHAGKLAPLEVAGEVFPALSDERQERHPFRPMDVKETVARNLNAWMQYADDRQAAGGSVKGLSGLAKVSRPTIDDIRAGKGGCGIDTLEKIANVYGLVAWQMLVPGNRPPWKPQIANEAAIEEEVERRAQHMVAKILREREALLGKETGRSGRAVKELALVGAAPGRKQKHRAGGAKGPAQKTPPPSKPGKPLPRRRVAAKVT
jgi:hypothetical protein